MPNPKAEPLVLSGEERPVLLAWVRRRKTAQALATRARILLRCAEGHKNPQVMNWLWRHPRFHLHSLRPAVHGLNLIERWFAELINRNCADPPTAASPHWKRRPAMDRRVERQSETVRMDQTCRRDPRDRRRLLRPNQRLTTLVLQPPWTTQSHFFRGSDD